MFSILMFQLLFIFFPGLVAITIVRASFSAENKLDNTEWIIYSFIVGVLCYLPLEFFTQFDMFSFVLKNETIFINALEVSLAFAISILYSLILIFLKNKEYFHFLLRYLKLSNRVGSKYLIEAILSSKDETINSLNSQWVIIRYKGSSFHYIGYISAVKMLKDNIEIILKNVSVYYEYTDEPEYTTEAVYIQDNPRHIMIEYLSKKSGK